MHPQAVTLITQRHSTAVRDPPRADITIFIFSIHDILQLPKTVVCFHAAYLQLLGLLPAEGLQWEAQVVGLSHGAKVKVILGVDAGRHVYVELQQLQKLTFQLIPFF